MKVLYICRKPSLISGGSRCQDANKEMLCRIAGVSNVFDYCKGEIGGNKFQRNINRIFIGRYNNFTSKDFKHIAELIKEKKITHIFFDGSRMGMIAKRIKREFPYTKIVTFFHNIEYIFSLNYIRKLCLYQRMLAQIDLFNIYLAEKAACLYSDITIALNTRDAELLKKKYGRYPDAIFPISLEDDFDPKYIVKHHNRIPIGLMVGSNFPPNANGLDWFVKNVLPHVNIKLIVIGSGMDLLSSKYNGIENLEIQGYVEDLKDTYAKADFMIMPIFEGSGMKVKTAEALKFGKFIFAAPEAVAGYKYSSNEIQVCNTANDFISTINKFNYHTYSDGFHSSARDVFIKYYSYEALEKNYRDLFTIKKYI